MISNKDIGEITQIRIMAREFKKKIKTGQANEINVNKVGNWCQKTIEYAGKIEDTFIKPERDALKEFRSIYNAKKDSVIPNLKELLSKFDEFNHKLKPYYFNWS